MIRRRAVPPAPGPLEDYATHFDALFSRANQRHAFRRYLEGLLLPAERNKTLTALANTEPIVGAQRREAQALQWFLSESTWDPDVVNQRRLELLSPAPSPSRRRRARWSSTNTATVSGDPHRSCGQAVPGQSRQSGHRGGLRHQPVSG